jgi:hypothetical protein
MRYVNPYFCNLCFSSKTDLITPCGREYFQKEIVSYGFSMKLFPAGSSIKNVKDDSDVAQARNFTKN